MSHSRPFAFLADLAGWDETWALAVVFGTVSVPWTYAFVVGGVPLWPSFIASASYYAAGGGPEGLLRGTASNVTGIAYAAVTIVIVDAVSGSSVVVLSVVVGAFMLLASLHDHVPVLSFTPGGFFGYATMFSVHEAGATAFGVPGVAGQTFAAAGGMVVGALIGFTTDVFSESIEG